MCGREGDDTSQVPVCRYIYIYTDELLFYHYSLRNRNTTQRRNVVYPIYYIIEMRSYYNSTYLLLCIKGMGTIVYTIGITYAYYDHVCSIMSVSIKQHNATWCV